MSKKEELSEQYRRKAYEVSPTRKRCQHNNEVIAWNNEIVGAFESGWDACEAESIETIKTAEDHAYFAGSETMREKLIDKACKWLENNLAQETSVITGGYVHINFENAIKDFRKYMES